MLALQVTYISIPKDLCVPPINATKTNWYCHRNAPSGHPQYLPTCFLLCITHEVAEEFFNQLKRSRCNTHNFSPEAMFQNHPFSGLYLSGQCRLSTQSPHCLQSWNFPRQLCSIQTRNVNRAPFFLGGNLQGVQLLRNVMASFISLRPPASWYLQPCY